MERIYNQALDGSLCVRLSICPSVTSLSITTKKVYNMWKLSWPPYRQPGGIGTGGVNWDSGQRDRMSRPVRARRPDSTLQSRSTPVNGTWNLTSPEWFSWKIRRRFPGSKLHWLVGPRKRLSIPIPRSFARFLRIEPRKRRRTVWKYPHPIASEI